MIRIPVRWVALLLVVLPCATGQEPPLFNADIIPLDFETLTYPPLARMARLQGVVVVRAGLGDEGKVIAPVALSGPKELIAACLENASKWRFQPNARKMVIIVYRFTFEGLCNSPCASSFHFEPPNFVWVTTGYPTWMPAAAQQLGRPKPTDGQTVPAAEAQKF